jgi:hypothetical protein
MATQRERLLRAAEKRIAFYEARIFALLSAYERNLAREIRRKLRSDDYPPSVAVLGGFDTMSLESRNALLEEIAFLFGDIYKETVSDFPAGVSSGLEQETVEAFIYEKLKEFSDLLSLQISRVRSQVLEGALVDGQLFLPEVSLVGNVDDAVVSGLVVFSRAISAASLPESTMVMYVGPKDSRNRPFCAERVGNVYSMAEVLTWDNGQGLPAVIYCGGHGCRHFLQPVEGA